MFLRCLLDDSKKFVRGLKDVFKRSVGSLLDVSKKFVRGLKDVFKVVFKMFKRRNELCKKFIDV
jgi:hypothetical protein